MYSSHVQTTKPQRGRQERNSMNQELSGVVRFKFDHQNKIGNLVAGDCFIDRFNTMYVVTIVGESIWWAESGLFRCVCAIKATASMRLRYVACESSIAMIEM